LLEKLTTGLKLTVVFLGFIGEVNVKTGGLWVCVQVPETWLLQVKSGSQQVANRKTSKGCL